MKKRKKGMKLLCLASAMAFGLTGCGDKSPLDPGNPVSLTIWHYYNGSQQAAFDSLVEEFRCRKGGSGENAGYLFFLCGYRL